jgi:hypothetical protein
MAFLAESLCILLKQDGTDELRSASRRAVERVLGITDEAHYSVHSWLECRVEE